MSSHPTYPSKTIDVVVYTEALFRRRRRWLFGVCVASGLDALLTQVLPRSAMLWLLVLIGTGCVIVFAWARDRRDLAYRLHSWAQIDWALMDHLGHLGDDIIARGNLRLLSRTHSRDHPVAAEHGDSGFANDRHGQSRLM